MPPRDRSVSNSDTESEDDILIIAEPEDEPVPPLVQRPITPPNGNRRRHIIAAYNAELSVLLDDTSSCDWGITSRMLEILESFGTLYNNELQREAAEIRRLHELLRPANCQCPQVCPLSRD